MIFQEFTICQKEKELLNKSKINMTLHWLPEGGVNEKCSP